MVIIIIIIPPPVIWAITEIKNNLVSGAEKKSVDCRFVGNPMLTFVEILARYYRFGNLSGNTKTHFSLEEWAEKGAPCTLPCHLTVCLWNYENEKDANTCIAHIVDDCHRIWGVDTSAEELQVTSEIDVKVSEWFYRRGYFSRYTVLSYSRLNDTNKLAKPHNMAVACYANYRSNYHLYFGTL